VGSLRQIFNSHGNPCRSNWTRGRDSTSRIDEEYPKKRLQLHPLMANQSTNTAAQTRVVEDP
jgi:hypothetical protein